MTRIALFGDIHGNVAALNAVLASIDASNPDFAVCLGDLVGYGAFPNEVIEIIRARAIPTIMGNYDDGIGFERGDCGCAYRSEEDRLNGEQSVAWTGANVTSENKAFLTTLLPEHRMNIAGHSVRVVHGSPRRMNEYLFEDRDEASLARIANVADCNVLVFGHTHKPWSRAIAGVLFVNAGSVGKPKDGDPRACWTMLEIQEGNDPVVTFHRVDYDIASMAAAIRLEPGLPDVYAWDIETGGAA